MAHRFFLDKPLRGREHCNESLCQNKRMEGSRRSVDLQRTRWLASTATKVTVDFLTEAGGGDKKGDD